MRLGNVVARIRNAFRRKPSYPEIMLRSLERTAKAPENIPKGKRPGPEKKK